MALQTGLRHPEKLAGLMCLSGYVPLAPMTPAERSGQPGHPGLHGARPLHDGVIPIARAEQSRDLLKSLGYQVEWHDYDAALAVPGRSRRYLKLCMGRLACEPDKFLSYWMK
jgi:predicted esterase